MDCEIEIAYQHSGCSEAEARLLGSRSPAARKQKPGCSEVTGAFWRGYTIGSVVNPDFLRMFVVKYFAFGGMAGTDYNGHIARTFGYVAID